MSLLWTAQAQFSFNFSENLEKFWGTTYVRNIGPIGLVHVGVIPPISFPDNFKLGIELQII
jgi:hypothetical protein